uniref:Uncharacterized protein n=1 Tax=Fagus sylvatica TaxID=28930 RepID=A0A2N9FCY0_FAGSY
MTSTKLKGSNYLQWSRAVLVFLTGRGKESYLTTTKPTDATKISKWIKEDAQIMTWLWNSLEPDVFNNVSYLESSKDIWDTLHLMYSSEENITRIHKLYQDMFSLQQGDRSIEEYFSLLQGMWDELNVYQPLSTDLQKQQKYREEFRVAKFLSGLKPDLDPIRSQILSGKDIPTVRETYARVRRAAISSSGVKDERSALVGHYDTPQGERGDHSSRRGTHNGRGGRGGRSGGGGRGPKKCTHCGRTNHTVDFCWKLHGKPAWANHATVDGDNSILLRSSPSWVIDSGASDHMTGNSSLLSNISDPCSPFSVTVANGTKTPVQGIGNCLPLLLRADKSPFSVLKVFGCVSFVHNLNPSRDNLILVHTSASFSVILALRKGGQLQDSILSSPVILGVCSTGSTISQVYVRRRHQGEALSQTPVGVGTGRDCFRLESYLGSNLQTVYMAQPPGFESKGEYVCHLKKSIYGLKQSPRAWFDKFSKAVVSHGMTRSQADHSVFFKKTKTGIVILVVYVDDIVITGSDKEGIQILINHLSSSFLTKYLGYLGSKPVATPMESNLKLMPDEVSVVVASFIDHLVTWRSKKQSVVARSSAEAEYRAMAHTTCELTWLRTVLQEFGLLTQGPTPLYCDNQAAIHIASNPVFHERTKHIEVDCHFVRSKVESKDISHRLYHLECHLASRHLILS